MPDALVYVTSAAAFVASLFAAWHTAKSYRFSNPLFYAVALVEALLVVALIWGIVAVSGTDRDIEKALYLSYLVTTVLIPPAAVLWGVGDKTRWGTGVVAVALFTVSVMLIRTHQIWQGHG
ncbi:hypothetical protein GL325_01920 [Aeromicrobium sp. 636]|uniref:Uncharacterized protein n=1 Tax=Aeromicrobium senzhongii TaxID=2663859 RepID=A0A8I0ETE2_9ACTN|nr:MULTISPECIES: hypothetical protein [Aeromicrobium]MBC9225073.1 hypothetical protein [Aeromicrobium senzhongii]MCQ3997183.1 hypothetical protein [Aeromicrobium sp. 636]MTB87122.1 hypothetical protein [Aeromicrobium senzhongii]QNL93064.1 hypothetical protein H9L21_07850 [Aeromicrobium senzhongii]